MTEDREESRVMQVEVDGVTQTRHFTMQQERAAGRGFWRKVPALLPGEILVETIDGKISIITAEKP